MAKLIKKGQKRGKYGGNKPKRELYPKMKIVAEFTDEHTNTTFDLWFTRRAKSKDNEWYVNFKLVCRQKRLKANFWFGYNQEREFIASKGDHFKLKAHYAELYNDLERFLLDNYSNKGE